MISYDQSYHGMIPGGHKAKPQCIFQPIDSSLVITVIAIASIILISAQIGEFWVYGILALIIVVLLVPSIYGLFSLANFRYKSIEI